VAINLTISKKLYGGFGIILAMLVALGGLSYMMLGRAIDDADLIKEKIYKQTDLAKGINLAVVQTQRWLTDISATRAADGYDDGFDEAEKQAESLREQLAELKEVAPEAAKSLSELGTSYEAFYEMGKKMARAYIDGGPAAGNMVIGNFNKHAVELSGRLENLVGGSENEMNKKLDQINRDLAYILFVIITTAVLAAFIGVGVSFFIVQSITNPLNKVVDVVKKIAKGDLTQEVTVRSSDELGQLASAMRMMERDLADMVGNIRISSETVSSGANQIASGTQDLSQRSLEQASALEETASTVEEITANIRASAENAQKANDIAQKAASAAQRGGDVVKKTVDSMQEVTNSSKKIGDIINVVNEIAFQTNLLALNAAVEAARAGEQGRGFAVVAGEVRNLAGRSAEAAKEIQSLINDSMEKVQVGNQLVEETGKTLNEIIESINIVAMTVTEISAASQEQAGGIEQVNRAVIQMDEVVQQNASLVEEAAATSENLTGQAEEMQRLMGTFKINGTNGTHQAGTLAAQKTTHWEKSTHLTDGWHFNKKSHLAKSVQPVKTKKETKLNSETETIAKKDNLSDPNDHFFEF